MNPRNLAHISKLEFLRPELARRLVQLGRCYAEESRICTGKLNELGPLRFVRPELFNPGDGNRIQKEYDYYQRQAMVLLGKSVLVKKILKDHGIKDRGWLAE